MKKSVKIIVHLIFWTISSLFMSLWLILPTFSHGRPDYHEILLGSIIILPIGAIIFYSSFFTFNYFARKATRFIWIVIGYLIVISIMIIKDNDIEFAGTILIFLFPVLYFNVFGFFFKTFVEWIIDRKIKAELEKDKLKSQLELIKSQINPHFFFNTLNNIEKVFFKDVYFIEGMRDYRNIQTDSKKILTLQTFGDLEKELPQSLFCRVHKSFIIQFNKIDTIEKNRIRIKDNWIPISETYKENFYKRIGFNKYGQKQSGHNIVKK